jgi:hypothetical protein
MAVSTGIVPQCGTALPGSRFILQHPQVSRPGLNNSALRAGAFVVQAFPLPQIFRLREIAKH